MASSSSANYHSGGHHNVAMILIIMFLLISLIPSKTVGLGFRPSYKKDHESNSVQLKEKEKVVGSRPPGCINKCLNCRPCMATLVIQPHQWKWNNRFKRFFKTTSHDNKEGDSSYYLLSWKCKCKNKLFQP